MRSEVTLLDLREFQNSFCVFYQTNSLHLFVVVDDAERGPRGFGFTCSCAKHLMEIKDRNKVCVYLLEQDKLYVGSASIIYIASATAYSNNLLVSSIEERELMICIVMSPLIPSKSLTYNRTTPSITGVPNLHISHHSYSLYLAHSSGSQVPDESLD